MKKIHAIALSALALNSFADEVVDKFQAEMKARYQLLDNEIRIVKLKNYLKPSIKNVDDRTRVEHRIAEMKRTKKDLDEKGYTFKPTPMINFLLHGIKDPIVRNNMKRITPHELSDSINGFKVGYDYKVIPSKFYDQHWGFSPMGGYQPCYDGTQNGCVEGWSGVVEGFEKENLTCAFEEHNTKIDHGGNELVEELITYSVNNKPTIELVVNDTSGYLYEVEWFQKDYDRKLECASTEYSKEILAQVISMAKEIDNR